MKGKTHKTSYKYEKLENLKIFLEENLEISELFKNIFGNDFDVWLKENFKGNEESKAWLMKNKLFIKSQIFRLPYKPIS